MDNNQQAQTLTDELQAGIYYQVLICMIQQALILKKEDTLSSLADTLVSFTNSLTLEEKKDFNERIDTMLKEKADAFVQEISKNSTPEELKAIQKDVLQPLTQQLDQIS
jgi:hypothetical protein